MAFLLPVRCENKHVVGTARNHEVIQQAHVYAYKKGMDDDEREDYIQHIVNNVLCVPEKRSCCRKELMTWIPEIMMDLLKYDRHENKKNIYPTFMDDDPFDVWESEVLNAGASSSYR